MVQTVCTPAAGVDYYTTTAGKTNVLGGKTTVKCGRKRSKMAGHCTVQGRRDRSPAQTRSQLGDPPPDSINVVTMSNFAAESAPRSSSMASGAWAKVATAVVAEWKIRVEDDESTKLISFQEARYVYGTCRTCRR